MGLSRFYSGLRALHIGFEIIIPKWYSAQGSNLQQSPCEDDALPIELTEHLKLAEDSLSPVQTTDLVSIQVTAWKILLINHLN